MGGFSFFYLFSFTLFLLVLSSNANQITPTVATYTFKFTQSITNFNVWTAPATRRIRDSDNSVPTDTGSTLSISSAMEELESFQVIIAPTSSYTSMTVSMSGFTNMGSTAWVDVGVASFTSVSPVAQGSFKVAESTTKVAVGGTVTLSSSLPTVLWITAYIPGVGTTSSSSSSYSSASLILTPNGHAAITIPVSLYVFNFKLSRTPHFSTFMNGLPLIEPNTLDDLDAWKAVYLQHRMAMPASDWPNGLSANVGWDCDNQKLIDAESADSTQSCIWANGCTMRRYIQGKGGEWRGAQYADWIDNGFQIYNPVRTDNSRPSSFCGASCGGDGWQCSKAYEDEWGVYLKALQDYFTLHNVTTSSVKGFWYTQNEPQNYNDYTISAYLCNIARTYAPKLPIMISREAQALIAERPEFNNCSYDIWLAHVWRYTPSYTRQRQYTNSETSWFYSLDTDMLCASPGVCGPSFAPAVSQSGNNGNEDPVATNDGPHYRVIPWVAWSNRITGWGYYLSSIFWDTPDAAPAPARPHISAALLREGFEDYEYLYIANGNKYPRPYIKESPDDSALSIGYAVGSWEKDPTAIHALRHELGKKIEGSRSDYPYLSVTPTRSYGNYYIDFQDTSNGAVADFTFQGKTWKAIGWDQYSVSNGYGWNSDLIGVPNTIQTGNPVLICINTDSGNQVESTICYNDYNSPAEFHFALSQGVYNVTVGIGWPGSCRSGDSEYVEINNVVFRNVTCSPCCSGVREYSKFVNVYPGANGAGIVMTFGNKEGYSEISYMKIETTTATLPPVYSSSATSSTSTKSSTTTTSAKISTSTTAATSTSATVATTTTSAKASTTGAVASTSTATKASTTTGVIASTTTSAKASTTGAVVSTSTAAKATTTGVITSTTTSAKASTTGAATSTSAKASTTGAVASTSTVTTAKSTTSTTSKPPTTTSTAAKSTTSTTSKPPTTTSTPTTSTTAKSTSTTIASTTSKTASTTLDGTTTEDTTPPGSTSGVATEINSCSLVKSSGIVLVSLLVVLLI